MTRRNSTDRRVSFNRSGNWLIRQSGLVSSNKVVVYCFLLLIILYPEYSRLYRLEMHLICLVPSSDVIIMGVIARYVCTAGISQPPFQRLK